MRAPKGGEAVNAKKILIAAVAAMALLVVAGVAYANGGSGGEGDGSYKASIAVPKQGGPSLQELAEIYQATAEHDAPKAVPGTVKETILRLRAAPWSTA
jgi:hypothetical protein